MGAYGWKATIGFIGPPRTNETVLHESIRLAPPGVAWCWSTMGLPEFGQYQFDEALSLAHVCARELAKREVDVIVMAGIPLITSKGAPYHETIAHELSATVEGRVPVTSDVACVMGACAALGMGSIVAASIYQRYIQDNMIRYFARYGIRTAADVALDYALADCMTQPTMTTALDTARRAWALAPQADGLFIACPQWPVIDHIAPLEEETGRPVLTHMSAVMWGALAQIGVQAPSEGRGRLLADWPQWRAVAAPA